MDIFASKSRENRDPHTLLRTLMCALIAVWPMISSAAAPNGAGGQQLTHHFIILFDELVPMHRNCAESEIARKSEQMLQSLGFDAERDYVSIGGYGLNLNDPDFDKFVTLYQDKQGKAIKWRQVKDMAELRSLTTWKPRVSRWSGVGNPGSMQSLAKQYGVMAVKRSENDTIVADETYVICITDEVINGSVDSYQQEWGNVSYYSPKFHTLRQGVFATVDGFTSWIEFDLVDHNYVITSTYSNEYKVVAYRARPKREPAVGASVVLLTQVRRSRGGYNVGFFYPAENANYRVSRVHFNDSLANDYALQVSDDAQWVNLRPESRDIDSLVVAVDVHLIDGYYNGFRFSGLNPHYYGLKIKQKMMMFDEPKILGFFKMPNWMWWWFPSDIYTAVHVWDLIIVLILLIVVCYAFYKAFVRITTYKPSLKNIDITYMK